MNKYILQLTHQGERKTVFIDALSPLDAKDKLTLHYPDSHNLLLLNDLTLDDLDK
jgi:hypothetical protein